MAGRWGAWTRDWHAEIIPPADRHLVRGEVRLLCRLLADAVNLATRCRWAREQGKWPTLEQADAWWWLLEDDAVTPFSFAWTMRCLERDPAAERRRFRSRIRAIPVVGKPPTLLRDPFASTAAMLASHRARNARRRAASIATHASVA